MKEHKSKYSRKSRRLKDWNYSNYGYYFITICTKNRKCIFGEIFNDSMELSGEGLVAETHLSEINQQFTFAEVDGFVVMPNHIHAILIINEDAINRASKGVTKNIGGFAGGKNPMLNNNVSKIIRWYKGRVTYEISKTNPSFAWQANFHDHIIRNDNAYQKIYNYVCNNPLLWNQDTFNPINNSL